MSQQTTRRAFLESLSAATWSAAGGFLIAVDSVEGGQDRAVPSVDDTFGLQRQGKKIPVIFDTDIGGDIDDTWALTMLLRSAECDVRLVVSDYKNATYRARILAKMLDVFGRTTVPVGVGHLKADKLGPQSEWVGDYTLDRYPGPVHEDGVQAIVDTILGSDEPVTLVCVGPVPNIREALKREPAIARKARFVGMHGSVRRGYGGSSKPSAEWNVRADPKALQAVFAAPWQITITPLDTCGIVQLQGARYQKVYTCQHPGVQALMANYRAWAKSKDASGKRIRPTERSSTLFDTVAVYLASSEQLTVMEELPLRVTDDGFTVIDKKQGRPTRCAMSWKSLDAYKDHLVERLTRE